MASPVANGHPATPPASDPAVVNPQVEPDVPITSLDDDGQSKRPRDARVIHLVLSSLGIHSYQERVPLQLLDFAYRYTSSVLSDSLRLSAEGYSAQNERAGGRRAAGANNEDGSITVTALRQAIAARTGYHFAGPLPKEFMLEQATERNRLALPKVERGYGVQLPPEKYCLTGVGWNLKDEWESEEDGEGDGEEAKESSSTEGREDQRMGGMEDHASEDEEGVGRMEDVFGEDGEGGDTSMAQD